MAEVEITTELQEIQSNLWGVNVRENIARALEKLQNLPEEPNPIQGSLNLSLLDTASWKLGLLKNSIQGKEDTLQSRKDQLDRIKARLEQASGRTILQYGKCGNDVYYTICDDGEAALYGTGATYDYRTGIIFVTDVSSERSVFYKNINIKKITISDGITRVGNGLFEDCPNAEAVFISVNTSDIGHGLQQLTIPSNVKSLEAYAFCDTAITDVIIPFNVTTWESYVFSECKKLTTVRVESSLIGGFAFTSCTALTSLTISANCTKIGTCMLTYCSSLTEITYEGTKAQWDAIEKGTNWDSRHGADHEDVLSKIICSDGNWIFNEETKTWEEETA